MNTSHTLPRLYIDQPLSNRQTVTLDQNACHYLRTVLRRQPGDHVRFFNGRDGEWSGLIESLGKKSGMAIASECLRKQTPSTPTLHLLFSLIKKKPLDFLIEKAVELGVTDLHPVLTDRTIRRDIKTDRLRAQSIEASEQCERLTIPTIHELEKLDTIIRTWDPSFPLCWGRERSDTVTPIHALKETPRAFLIGPEGGFTDKECRYLDSLPYILPVSLGNTLYKAETAALLCLSFAHLRDLATITS